MFQEFFSPKKIASDRKPVEIIQARFVDAKGVGDFLKKLTAHNNEEQLHQARSEHELYIRPTLGKNSFDALLPILIPVSPFIRLFRNFSKVSDGLFDNVDFLSIRDTRSKKYIGFMTVERQQDDRNCIEQTIYTLPEAKANGLEKEAMRLGLEHAREIFKSQDVRYVTFTRKDFMQELGLNYEKPADLVTDSPLDKRSKLREVYRATIDDVTAKLAA